MSRVALIGDNSVNYVSVLLDIWNNGDCAVLIDWRIPFQKAYEMMLDAKVNICHIENKVFEGIKADDFPLLQYKVYKNDESTVQELPVALYEKFRNNYSNDEAIIIYSSGTTGESKGVILSHYAISINADSIANYMKLTSSDCLYMVKTISHLSSITGELLLSLKNKYKIIIGPVIVPPRVILRNVQKYHVTTMCINPTLLKLIVNEYERNKYDITSLCGIYVHGAKADDKLRERAKNVYKGCNIYYEYGLTEAGPRVTSQKVKGVNNSSVGRPISGVEIVIVDENGNMAPIEERGIIHVNTPSRYSGYVTGREKHISLYEGWLNTGDVGYLDTDGELHVVDRSDDIIIVNAHKVYPGDIEHVILENEEIIDCAVSRCIYNNSELIGCLYVSNMDLAVDILLKLKMIFMPYEIPKRFIRVSSIPHNERGKVNRIEVEKILSQ